MTSFENAGPVVLRRRRRKAPVLMAWAMAVVAAGVFGVFVYQAAGFGYDDEASLAPAQPRAQPQTQAAGKSEAGRERFALSNSEVAGFDNEKQPYTITAQSARQDKQQPNLVHMDNVSGALRRADGRKMDITATAGLFNSDDKSLNLTGNVAIVLQDTFTASMARATVDVQKKSLMSQENVLVELEGGQIFSSGIEVSDNGAHVLFRSNVRAQFDDTGGGPAVSTGQSADGGATNSSKGNLQQ